MAGNPIIPSGYEIVQAKSTIDETLKIMREKKMSFVLVENSNKEVVGIVTLKDILKSYEYLTSPTKLQKPTRVIMSQPLLKISADKVGKATTYMIKNKIRHLPITANSSPDSEIIGVVDMECLLRTSYMKEKMAAPVEKNLAIYSGDASLYKVLKKSMDEFPHIMVDRLTASQMKTKETIDAFVQEYEFCILDVVDKKTLLLPEKILSAINKHNRRMLIVVDPKMLKNEDQLETIRDLAKRKRIKIFRKPINIHDVVFACID